MRRSQAQGHNLVTHNRFGHAHSISIAPRPRYLFYQCRPERPLMPHIGYAFRSDGRYFVLAERHKSKDTLGVYDTSDNYRLVRVSNGHGVNGLQRAM